jgi:hypothetical protein
MTTDKRWEELTVYRPLTKEELKPAYKDLTKIVADNLSHFGFKLYGRKLIRLSTDLFHIIHLDTRGSWTGLGDTFEIEIAIVTVCDTDTFLRNFELTGSRKILDLIPKLRNHYRITQEYKLLADFLTRKIIEFVLPYFDRYSSSKQILADRKNFKIDKMTALTERNGNLILFSELLNHLDNNATEILTAKLEQLYQAYPKKDKGLEYFEETENYLSWLKSNSWDKIKSNLAGRQKEIFKKLKIANEN